ncbi:hypothetical protein CHS0354_030266, partial [Potamilus streckersoni]
TCRNLSDSEADELRAEMVGILNKNGNQKKPNISKDERKVLASLQIDNDIIILPVDKPLTKHN